MTMEAASMQSQALMVARAQVAAELAQLRAERDWLADRLIEKVSWCCPDDIADCEHYIFGRCFVDVVTHGVHRACWQRAAAKATEPKEATE